MSLKIKAKRAFRGDQEFFCILDADLEDWARAQGLTRLQAHLAALGEGVFPEVYERNFPSLSASEQLTLLESRVLVVGLGGLGGTLAVLLARLGVGRLLLADGDVFGPANLNRQILATRRTLGRSKAAVTARHLRSINPALVVKAIPQFLEERNLPRFLQQVQVALDGLDNLEGRRCLFEACRAGNVPLVHGAVAGVFGQVATILPDDHLAFEKIYSLERTAHPETPPGVLAPAVSLIASLQALEAVRLLLGKPPAYRGSLAHFDGDTGRLESLPLR